MKKILIRDNAVKIDNIQHGIKRYNLITKSIHNKKRPDLNIIWAYPFYMNIKDLPDFGFKLHISATIINALPIMDKLVPHLLANNIAFKMIGSLSCLKKLNQGNYGYSQIGKFITIYPANDLLAYNHAYKIAKILFEFKSIKIPSDLQLSHNSIVYYRYGSFKKNSKIKLPNGLLINDQRNPKNVIPPGIKNIFPIYEDDQNNKLLANRIIVLKVIRQTAKGTVLLGFDLSTHKILIVKEGRKFSVMEDSAIDGYDRLKWAAVIQDIIEEYRITPDKIFYHEEQDSNFLGIEYFHSKSLSRILLSKKELIHEQKTNILITLIKYIHKCHTKKIYLNDVSPDNILVNKKGVTKIIDFEYCIKDDHPPFPGWEMGTPGFAPKAKFLEQLSLSSNQKHFLRDIYAVRQLIFAFMNPNWYKAIVKGRHLEQSDWGVRFYLKRNSFKVLFNRISLNPLSYKSILDLLPIIDDLSKLKY